jgi:hypothetical protein
VNACIFTSSLCAIAGIELVCLIWIMCLTYPSEMCHALMTAVAHKAQQSSTKGPTCSPSTYQHQQVIREAGDMESLLEGCAGYCDPSLRWRLQRLLEPALNHVVTVRVRHSFKCHSPVAVGYEATWYCRLLWACPERMLHSSTAAGICSVARSAAC